MSERETLEALLARVLEGTGPDRELDRAIAMALTPKARRGMYVRRHYTASLDAALTLVPEGWTWKRFHSGVFECAMLDDRRALFERGDAATPARALIAACIKARMEAQGE